MFDLRFLASLLYYAQGHCDDPEAWDVGLPARHERFECLSHTVACVLSQHTVHGDEGVDSAVVLGELSEHPAKSIDAWVEILNAKAELWGGWLPDAPVADERPEGLYGKFHVSRRDGRDRPGGDREAAQYFVLDLTYDPYAIPALETYADRCETCYPQLSRDLRQQVKDRRQRLHTRDSAAVPKAHQDDPTLDVYRCPVCRRFGRRRSGAGHEQQFRCPDCTVVWEPAAIVKYRQDCVSRAAESGSSGA